MTRREIREQVFILLFQREFYGREPFDEQKETYMETKEWTEKDQAYIEEHMAKIMDKLPEIDELISEHSNGWKLDRIGKEELAILRLAIYEAKFDEEIPVGVAVNEAVELAKTYGEDGGAAFVNGIVPCACRFQGIYARRLHLQILGGIKNGSKSSNQWFWPYRSSCFQTDVWSRRI